jgi:hypothetical protein
MEPGVLFPPAILRSEIKGNGLNGIATIHGGKRGTKEGATGRVRQIHRIDDFRLMIDD